MKARNMGGKIFLSALIASALSASGAKSWADTDFQFAKYLQSVKFSGDYRLRFDEEHFRTPSPSGVNAGDKGAPDRDRFRMRLRLALNLALPAKFTLKTRLATGQGEQTSTNQTFGSLDTEKGIWVDRAYLEWAPKDGIKVEGGKMAMPLWTQYSSDALWDDDLNPEGAGENLSALFGGVNVFFNAMQGVVDENSASIHDQYVFSEQIGTEFRLPAESRFKIAYAYHDWKNANQDNFQGVAVANNVTGSAEKVQEGNRRITNNGSANTLANPFGVSEVSGQFSFWTLRTPIAIQGTYLKNERVRQTNANGLKNAGGDNNKDTGYQIGAIVGKAALANSWEAAYFYKYLEADSTVADAADSDFGDGGTNRRGHIMWAAYNPTDWLTYKLKYFQTQNIDRSLAGSKGSMDRIQIDAAVKF
jgi:hypothetical protein